MQVFYTCNRREVIQREASASRAGCESRHLSRLGPPLDVHAPLRSPLWNRWQLRERHGYQPTIQLTPVVAIILHWSVSRPSLMPFKISPVRLRSIGIFPPTTMDATYRRFFPRLPQPMAYSTQLLLRRSSSCSKKNSVSKTRLKNLSKTLSVQSPENTRASSTGATRSLPQS